MDIKSKDERSKNMSNIRSKNTKPELYIRSLLHKAGYRYRVCPSDIFGKPDLYFSSIKTAVFIHGCFWHRHTDCKYSYNPKSNVEFWNKKFESNVSRDIYVKKHLLNENIRILVIWECTIKKAMTNHEKCQTLLENIVYFLYVSNEFYLEL